ncbi:hypothetical protein NKH99_30355 [Mesorhizobium sp. M0854]|uniref:hypothetical protein n=1 Tax=Mesorhizobium sp. M0854 TaxID=2957013 RepID=UPI0033388B58
MSTLLAIRVDSPFALCGGLSVNRHQLFQPFLTSDLAVNVPSSAICDSKDFVKLFEVSVATFYLQAVWHGALDKFWRVAICKRRPSAISAISSPQQNAETTSQPLGMESHESPMV